MVQPKLVKQTPDEDVHVFRKSTTAIKLRLEKSQKKNRKSPQITFGTKKELSQKSS